MRDIKFGTGGWRAVIDDDFTKENVIRLGYGIGRWLNETDRFETVVIGYDRRRYSEFAAGWLAQALTESGINVSVTNTEVSSPSVMYAVKSMHLNCGLMVTASHNPGNYNGVKVFIEEGYDAPREVTEEIEKAIPKGKFKSSKRGVRTTTRSIVSSFGEYIYSKLDSGAIMLAHPKVLFDAMNGSAVHPFEDLCRKCACNIETINGYRDYNFGGRMPAPEKSNLVRLIDRVKNEDFDIGIAFDGDGDRIAVIDDTGEFIDANELLCMLYRYLHEYKGEKGPIVKNLCTTSRIEKVAEDLGEKCYETPVGFKWISSKMNETNALIGGESSGGMTFRNYIHGKDSTYTAMLVLEMMGKTRKKLSDIKRELREKHGNPIFLTSNLAYTESREKIEEKLLKISPAFSDVKETFTYDGVKLVFNDGGFISCRLSGTEPLVRIMVECKDRKTATDRIQKCKSFLNE